MLVTTDDLDDIVATGCYWVRDANDNKPIMKNGKGGLLLVSTYSNNYITQVFVGYDTGNPFFTRSRLGSTVWKPWLSVTTYAYTKTLTDVTLTTNPDNNYVWRIADDLSNCEPIGVTIAGWKNMNNFITITPALNTDKTAIYMFSTNNVHFDRLTLVLTYKMKED